MSKKYYYYHYLLHIKSQALSLLRFPLESLKCPQLASMVHCCNTKHTIGNILKIFVLRVLMLFIVLRKQIYPDLDKLVTTQMAIGLITKILFTG